MDRYPAPPGHALAACALDLPPPRGPQAACAAGNLTGAFASQGLSSVTRAVYLDPTRTQLTVSDSWTLAAAALSGAGTAPTNVTAAFHTFAANVTVAADGGSVVLEQNGLAVVVAVAPWGACFGRAAITATAVRLAPPQEPSDGLTRIDITVDPRVCSGLDVVLAPRTT